MKKLKKMLLVLLMIMMVVPSYVFAEEEEEEVTTKEPVTVYMFRGEGCTYCAAALEWFESIEEEYGDYFDLVTYEVWYDTDNSELMQEVADVLGDTASGVPYIIVGNYSYPNGFASDTVVDSTTGETMADQLLAQIMEVYNSDNRYDVMVEVNNKPNYDTVVGVVACVIIVGGVVIAVISRKQNKED